MGYLLSVVVPCYNAEKTIRKCIDSLLNATVENMEILLINDGSKDGTKAIIEEYSIKFSNISSYTKENEGLGKTRNFGINRATGKYVAFIDSDDYIEPDAYKVLIDRLENDDADVVYGGLKYVYDDRIRVDKFDCEEIYDDYNKFAQYVLRIETPYAGVSACTGIYKRELLLQMGECFFPEKEYLSEDKVFNLRYVRNAKRISLINKDFYNYIQHSTSSITSSYKPYKVRATKNMYNYLVDLYGEDFKQLLLRDYLVNLSACFIQLFMDDSLSILKKYSICKDVLNSKEILLSLKELETNSLSLKFKLFRCFVVHKLSCLCSFMFAINDIRRKQ